MNAEQWLGSTDPVLMLEFLRDSGIPVTARKLYLLAAACCRRIWHLLDADARAVVELSERFADGLAGEAELRAAVWASRGCRDVNARAAVDYAAVGAWRPAVALLAGLGGPPAAAAAAPDDDDALARRRAAEEGVQADLLRCVYGPRPLGRTVVESSWRTTAVLGLARHAYEAQDFSGLPALADALEEVGCDESAFLTHLRGGGPHCRGCYVLDALLGKE